MLSAVPALCTVQASMRELPVVLAAHSWGTGVAILLLPRIQAVLGHRLRGLCTSGNASIPPELGGGASP
jgi:alpha-beta hydrolase superfamily lysophospholipase